MVERVDALIIGGGPAGLAAAIVLGRAGLQVLLCEQEKFPVDKVCGEGLMPTGRRALGQLHVEVEGGFPFVGVRYHAPGGRTASARFGEGAGLGVRRTTLSEALFRRAQQVGSLRLVDNTCAMPQAVHHNGVDVRVGQQEVRARLLIGADGLNSRVRRWAGLEKRGRRHWRWGARQHYRLLPWSEYVEVFWSREGVEAYVTPTGVEEVGVAFLWTKDRSSSVQGGRCLFPSLLQLFPLLQSRLQQAVPLNDVAAIGPLQQRVQHVTSDGALLIGDAAGYLDAITGEGLSLALAQALALEKTVVPAMEETSGLVSAQALADYEAVHRAIVRSNTCLTELALLMSRYPPLCDWVIQALQINPGSFQQLLSANMGQLALYRPSLWAGLIASLLKVLLL